MTKQNEKKKSYLLRIPENSFDQICKRASELGMSTNKYLLHSAEEEMKQADAEAVSTNEVVPKKMTIRLSEEQRELIRKRASARGLSIRQYMDWLLNKRSDVDITIAVTDFEAIEKQVDDLITVFNGVASVIIRSGKVYEGELNTLLASMNEINEYFKKLYRDEHDNRYQLYAECRKRLFEDIEKASFIKRNRIKDKE